MSCDCFVFVQETDEFRMWQGLVGPYYTPSVDSIGNLSWTNNGNLVNPPTVNVSGRGLTIVGIVDTAGDLPESAPNYAVYLVGTISPYHAYIFDGTTWTDLGVVGKGDKGDPGQGVPSGGTTGQVLKKKSATDYDTAWKNDDLGITGASVGDLVRISTVDTNNKPTAFTKVPLNAIKCNRNLLVNGYFVGGGSQLGYGTFPINQRGQGTYMLSSDSYSIDRWASFQSGSKHTLNSYGVLIETNGTNYAQIAQRVSNFPQGTITISFLTGNSAPTNAVRIYLKFSDNTSNYYDCSGLGQNDLGYHSFNVSKTVTEIRLYTNAAGSKFSLQAVKAELGPTQTLAHQESGVWVLNEIPDYATELAKCQAYFIKIAFVSEYSCSLGLGGSNPRITIPLPATMAKAPTFTKTGGEGFVFCVGESTVFVGSSSSSIQISGGYNTTLLPNAVRVTFQTTNSIGTSFLPCAVEVPAFELSAE